MVSEIICSLINSAAIVFAALVARYGITSWIHEFKGKRKIEVAEDALEHFYKVRDAIAYMRNPISYGDEGTKREVAEKETNVEKRARDAANVVYERHNKHIETFNKLYAMRYRFMARIGKEKAEPFEQIQKVVNEILIAAQMLAHLWAKQQRRHIPETTEKLQQSVDKFESIFWYSGSEDDINKRVAKAIADIEQTCNNIIMKTEQKE